ncbi:hypothetical protein BH18ACT12_BH18ACT12_04440 [soil metagenome]
MKAREPFPIVYVDDVARSERFYCDAFRFEAVYRVPADGPSDFVYLQLAPSGIVVGAASGENVHGRPVAPGNDLSGSFSMSTTLTTAARGCAHSALRSSVLPQTSRGASGERISPIPMRSSWRDWAVSRPLAEIDSASYYQAFGVVAVLDILDIVLQPVIRRLGTPSASVTGGRAGCFTLVLAGGRRREHETHGDLPDEVATTLREARDRGERVARIELGDV